MQVRIFKTKFRLVRDNCALLQIKGQNYNEKTCIFVAFSAFQLNQRRFLLLRLPFRIFTWLLEVPTNVDSISTISEAIFNKKLWELAGVYRGINFKDNVQKIDFTVGFVALEYFEEKEEMDGAKDSSKVYWSSCNDAVAEKIKNNLNGYISRLEEETTFKEFKNVMEVVRTAISGDGKGKPLVDVEAVKQIYDIIDSMKPLHGTGFDLFGAYIHMDEQTPHLHLDWLPVTETTRGLTTKVSLEGALKQIGFARSKSDKYDKTPYKRWLSDRRKGYEDFWQQTADELLGKGTIKVLPSEPTASPHKETWEHREVQKGLAKVTDFISGKGAKKVAAAEEIIANAKQINKALCDEGNQRIAAAQRREGAAARIEKAVENKRLALNKNIEDYNIKEEKLRHSAKVLSNRIAKQKITVEKEVQRRLSPHNFAQRHHEENERYLQKQRSIFAVALEQAQQQGKEEQQRKQALFEKAKYKTTKKTKGDWER